MVEVTLPIVLQMVQTIALIVGIIYYLTIMRNQQRTRELALKAQEHATETRQTQIFMQLRARSIISHWEQLESVIKEERRDLNYPQAAEWFEYLYYVIRQIAERQHPELKT